MRPDTASWRDVCVRLLVRQLSLLKLTRHWRLNSPHENAFQE